MATIGLAQILLGIAGAFFLGLPAGAGIGISVAASTGSMVGFLALQPEKQPTTAHGFDESDDDEVAESTKTDSEGAEDASDVDETEKVAAVVTKEAVPSDPVGDLITVKDKMCACKDMLCISGLQADLTAAGQNIGKNPAAVQARAADLQAVGKELAACMQRIAGAAAAP